MDNSAHTDRLVRSFAVGKSESARSPLAGRAVSAWLGTSNGRRASYGEDPPDETAQLAAILSQMSIAGFVRKLNSDYSHPCGIFSKLFSLFSSEPSTASASTTIKSTSAASTASAATTAPAIGTAATASASTAAASAAARATALRGLAALDEELLALQPVRRRVDFVALLQLLQEGRVGRGHVEVDLVERPEDFDDLTDLAALRVVKEGFCERHGRVRRAKFV